MPCRVCIMIAKERFKPIALCLETLQIWDCFINQGKGAFTLRAFCLLMLNQRFCLDDSVADFHRACLKVDILPTQTTDLATPQSII